MLWYNDSTVSPLPAGGKPLALATARELPLYFLRDEVRTILDNLAGAGREMDYLVVSFLWQTGVRVSECISVRVEDIDFRLRQVRIRTLKKKRGLIHRVIPLKPDFLGELAVWINRNGLRPPDRLFPVSRVRVFQIVRNAVLQAGFDRRRAHPHVFRHSFAVHCILSGVPVLVVKEWLGHSNITTTLVYLKVLARDTRQFHDMLEF